MEAKKYEPTAYLAGHSRGWNDGFKAGIKEVVEDMARTLETAPHHKTIASMWQCLQKWQAKLKEWGIKEKT